ncbi:uncharacterized protein LOC106437500 isoform X2 [Brassica napus]|uniref:uncharacterized protein LOC106437500 isoform X2 n=1 Tax=Brassica napus TaxID=3708 RepID=UPI00207A8C34|nr:uncharacterized protein LOC106437500 isoform X2 [Brassica napus]
MNYNSSFNAPYLLSRRVAYGFSWPRVSVPNKRSFHHHPRFLLMEISLVKFTTAVVADDKSKTGRSSLSLILRSFFPVSTCVSLVSYVVGVLSCKSSEICEFMKVFKKLTKGSYIWSKGM